MTNIIPIGCDHAGYELKEYLMTYLTKKGYSMNDFGCFSPESIDYADYGHKVASVIADSNGAKGILICGSGNGINMTANKHVGIRAALCWNKEIAELARLHNDANILVMPARFITHEEANEIVDVFFKTNFEGGRHKGRIEKIPLSTCLQRN